MVLGTVERPSTHCWIWQRLGFAVRGVTNQGRQYTEGPVLHTVAGEVISRCRSCGAETFETAIIERYRKLESNVEEALSVSSSGDGIMQPTG